MLVVSDSNGRTCKHIFPFKRTTKFQEALNENRL